MTSEAQLRAQAKYDRANTKQIILKLNRTSDADILSKLDQVGNRQGYIKGLIRNDVRTLAKKLPVDSIRLLIMPVAKRYDLAKVYLFGSYARGTATEASDVDLVVEGGSIKNMYEYNNLLDALANAIGKSVDLLMASAVEKDESRAGKRLRENYERERVLIYDKNQ